MRFWALAFAIATTAALTCHAESNPLADEGRYQVAPVIAPELAPFDLAEVRLLDGPFHEAQQVSRAYLLRLDPDRLLAPFRVDAGLPKKADSYGGWEKSGLDGHMLGHYLTAISLMYRATGDEEFYRRADYIVDELAACQAANGNGYVGGVKDGKRIWGEIAEGKIETPNGFNLNGGWVPFYNLHKLIAGLRDAYLFTGNEKARDVLVRLTDWLDNLVTQLSDDDLQRILSVEQGGMQEALADVYAMTGDKKHLNLARRFSHHAMLDPLARQEDKLDGLHANTQVPKAIAWQRVYELTNDDSFGEAAGFFWQRVATARSCVIGGHSVKEHFHPVDKFELMVNERVGPETCNTYNMLRLSRQLFLQQPSAELIDFYERALFNHILSSQHPEHGGLVYYTPMKPGHYRTYSNDFDDCWCCVGTGMENHAKYGELIYASSDNRLIVNLFIASELNWKDQDVTLSQETKFPDEPRTTLRLSMAESKSFRLDVRYPSWVATGTMRIRINSTDQKIGGHPGSYVSLDRQWRDGDVVEVELPMQLAAVPLPGQPDYVSFLYGPIVLAGEAGTTGLQRDLRSEGNVAQEELPPDLVPTLVGEREALLESIRPIADQPLTFESPSFTRPAPVRMIPLFRLHDQRYVIYWHVQPSTAD